MFEWSAEQLMMQDAIRRFIDEEVVPNIEALEHGDLPPYDIVRKLYATFGMDAMARDRFDKQIAFERSVAEAEANGTEPPTRPVREGGDGEARP